MGGGRGGGKAKVRKWAGQGMREKRRKGKERREEEREREDEGRKEEGEKTLVEI